MSLRLKLTLWFTAILAVALALFSFLVFALVAPALDAEIDTSIVARAHDLALSVRYNAGNQQIAVPTRSRVPESQFTAPSMYSEIRDPDGRIVYRSETLQGGDLTTSHATLDQARDGLPVFETIHQANQAIRLYTAPIDLNGHFIGYVQVGRNLADIDVVLNHLRTWLLPSATIVLLVAAAGGWLLAWLALRPMDHLGQEARAIGLAQRIDRRLPVSSVADEVQRLAITFNEMLDRLEAAFEAQQRFVADASHELRTPLTTIQGNVDFLRRTPGLSLAERAEALTDVSVEAARMARLVNGLLALARADAGRHLDRRRVELAPILVACSHEAQALARPAQVEVEVDLARLATGASVLADPDRLIELITILVDNAVKYNHPAGTVRIIGSSAGGIHSIAVQDSGAGIAADDLPHIFERFYRSADARAEDGTGLGLAIAHWLAQEHGAKIAVESKVGIGTTFTLTVPASRPSATLVAS